MPVREVEWIDAICADVIRMGRAASSSFGGGKYGAYVPSGLSSTTPPLPRRLSCSEPQTHTRAPIYPGGTLGLIKMAQGLLKDQQEALRLLVQHVSRAFYEPKFTVVMDQLVRHPV